ncbi:hypothetical protein RFY44_20625 [Acinetobacter bereziniae]|nr:MULTISPECIES: hypothetical protein [Acinetobacter]ELW80748.1 hypothetical protein ACINWC743_A0558 [Acinetobacter sp. WC-743]MDQ9821251.1 hypothetical protein [Acinetobacter bereziniae]
MFELKKTTVFFFFSILILLFAQGVNASTVTMEAIPDYELSKVHGIASPMENLSDEELGEVDGQALMSLSYIAPSDSNNLENNVNGIKNIGFYKLGLEAQLELNANIKKLQLGCGGVNGAGGCDIDMDNVSLSGLKLDSSGNPLPMTREERASSSAQLTNPFIEFAIKNPNSASQREVVGLRVGSELAKGLLTIGQNDGTINGINSLSGYMNIAPTDGKTKTAVGQMREVFTGKVNIGGCILGCPAKFTTDTKPIQIDGMDVNFTTKSTDLNGSRKSFINVGAIAKVPDIVLTENSGTRKADISGCFVVLIIPLCNYAINDMRIDGKISNLYVDVNLTQALGLIHSIPVQSPLSLSLQYQNILWPNAPKSPVTNQYITAQRGWWLAASDPIKLGALETQAGFAADISTAYPQVATIVSNYLDRYPLSVPFGDAVGSLFTSKLVAKLGTIDLNSYTNPSVGGTPISVQLNNLPLGAVQNVTPNCYGSLKFC